MCNAARTYAVLAVAGLALWPAIAFLLHDWRHIHDYQYGYLIAAVSVGWLVALRHKLNAAVVRPHPVGFTLLVLALLVWSIAFRASSILGTQLLLPVVLCLAVYAAFGPHVARLVAGPLAYLYFSVPLWDLLLPTLQALSVFASESMLRVVGIDAVVQQSLVTIPEGTFHIAEGCSGKRYFMVTLAVAALAASACGIRGARFVATLAIAAGLALLANWIRIFIVIYAGHVTNMESYLVAVEHRTLGYIIFGVLLVTASLVALRLAPKERVRPPPTSVAAPPERRSARGWWYVLPVLVAASAVTVPRAGAEGVSPRLGTFPVLTGTWSGPLPSRSLWQPQFAGPADSARAAYTTLGNTVDVYANVFGEQSAGSELIRLSNHPYDYTRWQLASRTSFTDRIASAFGAPLYLTVKDPQDRRWVVAYIYSIGGTRTASELLAQLIYGAKSLTRAVPSGVVAFATPCAPAGDCRAATEVLHAFWTDLGVHMMAVVPGAMPRSDTRGSDSNG